jgi:hypothetical protein
MSTAKMSTQEERREEYREVMREMLAASSITEEEFVADLAEREHMPAAMGALTLTDGVVDALVEHWQVGTYELAQAAVRSWLWEHCPFE